MSWFPYTVIIVVSIREITTMFEENDYSFLLTRNHYSFHCRLVTKSITTQISMEMIINSSQATDLEID